MIPPEYAASMAGKIQHTLDQMQGIINGQALEIAWIKAKIEAEIAWHEAEAKVRRDAQNEAADAGDIEEAILHKCEAIGHEIAAYRLAAILKPQETADDIAF